MATSVIHVKAAVHIDRHTLRSRTGLTPYYMKYNYPALYNEHYPRAEADTEENATKGMNLQGASEEALGLVHLWNQKVYPEVRKLEEMVGRLGVKIHHAKLNNKIDGPAMRIRLGIYNTSSSSSTWETGHLEFVFHSAHRFQVVTESDKRARVDMGLVYVNAPDFFDQLGDAIGMGLLKMQGIEPSWYAKKDASLDDVVELLQELLQKE